MRYKFRTGWVVSVTTPASGGRSAVRELYHAAIPCAVAAVRAVTTVSRARSDALVEAQEVLTSWEVVSLELKPGEARPL